VIGRAMWMAPALALVLATAGCETGTADRWIKERLSSTPTAVRVIQIESEQPDMRREAVMAVAADRGVRAVPSVVKLFSLVARTDKDPMVRSAAVRGLVNMQGDGIADTLGYVLLHDRNQFVRCDAAQALGNRVPPEHADALAEALRTDASGDVRLAAAEALRQFKDKAAAEALVAAVQDPSIAVAYRSWEGLRYMTGQNLPREAAAWKQFLAGAENPFAAYGRPPPMPQGENQRPVLKRGLSDFFSGLFAKDVRQAELE